MKKKVLSKKPTSARSKPSAQKTLPKKKSVSAKPLPKKKARPVTTTKSSKKESSKKSVTPPKKMSASTTKKSALKNKKLPSNIETSRSALQQTFVLKPVKKKNISLSPFLKKQQQRLLQLKDMLLDSMSGIARSHLHEGSDASAFGEHQADAGSDAYDRDFSLSIISQEQNSLYEIDEALKRIDDGTYGICELSNKQIPRARLEARPFTRYTVECQAELEKRQHVSGARVPVSALFGVTEEETEHEEEEGFNDNPKE